MQKQSEPRSAAAESAAQRMHCVLAPPRCVPSIALVSSRLFLRPASFFRVACSAPLSCGILTHRAQQRSSSRSMRWRCVVCADTGYTLVAPRSSDEHAAHIRIRIRIGGASAMIPSGAMTVQMLAIPPRCCPIVRSRCSVRLVLLLCLLSLLCVSGEYSSPYITPNAFATFFSRYSDPGMMITPLTPSEILDPNIGFLYVAADPIVEVIGRRIAEVAFVEGMFYALRSYNGSVLLGTSISGNNAGPWVEEQLAGSWRMMSNADYHLCFLSSDYHISCRAGGFALRPQYGALLTDQAATRFSQVSAAGAHTCGLRLSDSRVECHGALTSDHVFPYPFHFNSSVLQYSQVAAQQGRGWCGLVLGSGDLACWNFGQDGVNATEVVTLPAPASPLYWRYPMWSGQTSFGCALRSDGQFQCLFRERSYGGVQTASVTATDEGSLVVAADQATGQLRYYDDIGGVTAAGVNIFFPMRFIGVDPRDGDDATCNCIITLDIAELPGFVPCRTLVRAMELLTFANTWVQLLPGLHVANGFTINTADTTVSSEPPPTLSSDELTMLTNGTWVTRTAASGQAVVIDCTGTAHCFTFSQATVAFTGLTFIGSSAHALNNPSADQFAQLQTTLTLDRVVIDQCGGAIAKNLGTLIVRNSNFTHVRSDSDVLGIVELNTVTLTMSDCLFADNTLPFADTFLRSCLRSEHLNTAIRLDIRRTVWCNNTASSGQAADVDRYRAPGGVSMQVLVSDSIQLYVSDCLFEDQVVLCESCNGGAVAVITDVPPATADYSIVFGMCVWNRCSHRDPEADGEYYFGNTFGGALAISELDVRAGGMWRGLTTAATVVINLCTFRDCQAVFGGAVAIGIVKDLDIRHSTFEGCRAEATGGAIRIESITHIQSTYTHTPISFAQLLYTLQFLTFRNSFARMDGGAVYAESVTTTLSVLASQFYNSSANHHGGALALVSCSMVTVQDSLIDGANALQGGAIDADATANTIIQSSSFARTRALTSGGAIATSNNNLQIFSSNFTDCALALSSAGLDRTKVVERVGGAISCVGGSVSLNTCSFSLCSALPNDLLLSSCAAFYDASTGLSNIGLGGVIDGHLTSIDVFETAVSDCSACSGGVFSSRSGSVSLRGGSISSVQAYAGGVLTALTSVPIIVNGIVASGVAAVAAGGALVLNQCESIDLTANDVFSTACTNGDGGFLWLHALRRPSLSIIGNFFRDVTAANGAGAVLFLQSTAGAFAAPDLIDDPSLDNRISHPGGSIALYGPVQASGLASLSWDGSVVQVYAGQLLSELAHPLQIAARDAYGALIMQDRNIIVQVTCPEVEFRGTTLRQVSARNGTALFTDLRILAEPGRYQLVFSAISQSNVFVNVSLVVSQQCPSGSFFSVLDRTCTTCASSTILVYNTTMNECLPCPAGWERKLVANATTGPLRDGVSCVMCPLGQVSTEGSTCAPCGPNTYQPTPFSPCVACSNVDGLLCAGDGLAQVETNFFAMTTVINGEQRIQTFQCPAGFCSAAKLQQPGVSVSASAVNSYDQCAFPRLASPTNLLCGECAEGYRPWGNKCSRCDSANGGLLLLVIVLSFGLCFWLLRSALVTSSAGHAVVVLYFVQTVMLELGTINRLLSWLNFTLFSPNSTTECIAPLTAFQQVQAQVLMPVALEVQLIIIGLIHFAAFKRWGSVAAAEPTPASGSPLFVRARHTTLLFVSWFSVDVYINATLSLMLFSYTQVCAACVNYMQCVDVGGVAVVFNQPAMHCDSDDYKKTRGLVIATLVLFVAGLPAGIGLFLATKKQRLVAAYRFIDERIAAEESDAPAPSSNSATARFVARYAPLFAMYSPRTSFWQLFVLSRRICFVAIAVLLVRDAEQKFMAFVLAHVVSQLAQLVAQPFRMRLLNAADFVAHLLLIVISATLTAHPPPDAGGVDVFVFMLVVPPLCLYPIVMLLQHSLARKDAAALAAQSDQKRDGIELGAWSANPAVAATTDCASPSAAAANSAASSSPLPSSPSGGRPVSTAAPLDPSSVHLESRPSAPLSRSFSVLSHSSRRHPSSASAASPRLPHLAGLLVSASDGGVGPQQASDDAQLNVQL